MIEGITRTDEQEGIYEVCYLDGLSCMICIPCISGFINSGYRHLTDDRVKGMYSASSSKEKEIRKVGLKLIELAQSSIKWRAFLNTTILLHFTKTHGISLQPEQLSRMNTCNCSLNNKKIKMQNKLHSGKN
jgi:hypothetical protein